MLVEKKMRWPLGGIFELPTWFITVYIYRVALSMATVKYLENGFLEILEIWYGVKSI
jgi:hypothetical protein